MNDQITAVYCRLSKEDLDKDLNKNLSESIKNQKSMLEAYAREREWSIYDFYIDEDYSGSDRDRPEFNRLITDSLLGHFNIVLCKKQARFARDIEYVEKYIHGLFAERQIRFVAVLDNIDTAAVSRSVRKASQINSLVDEWYLSDLSENIIAALNTKRKNAEFIGSWAPYGYRKDPNNKNALMLDPEAAEVVKIIYDWYCRGWGVGKIAQELNSQQIPNPLRYKQLKGEKINPNPEKSSSRRYLWSPSSISAILHNQTYTGYLVQGKYKKAGYKSKKLLRVPKADWIVIPGCHDEIVDLKTWESVQKTLASRCRTSAWRQYHHALAGKVFCRQCGSRLVSSGGRSGARKTSYLCCSKHNIAKEACSGSRIESAELERLLLDQFKFLLDRYLDEGYLRNCIDSNLLPTVSLKTKLTAKLTALQNRLAATERQKEILYSDRMEGIITREQYIVHSNRVSDEASSLLFQQQMIQRDLSETTDQENFNSCWSEIACRYLIPEKLTMDLVNPLLDSVYISRREKGKPQEITINWIF